MDAARAPITAWTPTSPSARGDRVVHENPSGRMRRQGPRRVAYGAFVCFGLASWVMTNTTYVELSYFMLHLPERLSIVPYAIFALQSANIYPILYMWLNAHHRYLSLERAVWICLFIALVVAVGMGVLWDRTVEVLGSSHSVAMLVLTHFGGLVSGVTTVIFYPYVATFPAIYTSALSTGEGLSGAIVGLLGLWQQPYAQELAFSVSTFYIAGVVIVVASIAAFAFLELHPSVSAEREHMIVGIMGENRRKVHTYDSTFVNPEEQAQAAPSTCSLRQRVFGWFWRELACQAVLAALFYGVLPSITSFLFARYSPQDPMRAAEHQMLTSTVTFFVDPAARFLTSFFRLYTVYLSTIFLVTAGIVLIVCTLLRSPPWSDNHEAGFLFPLVLYISSAGVYSYTQTMLMLTVKQQADYTRDAVFASAAYQWSGFAIQMGAFAGTLVIFPLTLACPQLFQANP